VFGGPAYHETGGDDIAKSYITENDLAMREEMILCRNVGRDRQEEVRVVQGSAGKGYGYDPTRES
jgi:hypothetical protein